MRKHQTFILSVVAVGAPLVPLPPAGGLLVSHSETPLDV
jgi:hypothetical protein